MIILEVSSDAKKVIEGTDAETKRAIAFLKNLSTSLNLRTKATIQFQMKLNRLRS